MLTVSWQAEPINRLSAGPPVGGFEVRSLGTYHAIQTIYAYHPHSHAHYIYWQVLGRFRFEAIVPKLLPVSPAGVSSIYSRP